MNKDQLKSLCITPDTTLKSAMLKLTDTAERILLVVNHHRKLEGTISDGDVRRGLINGLGLTSPVSLIIQKRYLSLRAGVQDLERHAKQLMVKNKIGQIPVVNDRGGVADLLLWTDIFGKDKPQKVHPAHDNYVVIMAGGKGTRLDPFTKILPKPLIPVGDKPIIEIIMERFAAHGFRKFIYTLNYKKEYILLFLKENKYPYEIDWIAEDHPLGSAGSLSLLKQRMTKPFFVINCDSLLDINFDEVLRWHKHSKAAMTIISCYNEFQIPFGVLEMSHGRLKRILEKPTHDVMINTGAYIVEPRMLSYMPVGKPLDMDELIRRTARKEKITAYPIAGGWLDIGRWEEYRKSLKHIGGVDVV